MRFASLGSGSEGNALIVEVGQTRVLIDCGFRVRDTVARLQTQRLKETIRLKDPEWPRWPRLKLPRPGTPRPRDGDNDA